MLISNEHLEWCKAQAAQRGFLGLASVDGLIAEIYTLRKLSDLAVAYHDACAARRPNQSPHDKFPLVTQPDDVALRRNEELTWQAFDKAVREVRGG